MARAEWAGVTAPLDRLLAVLRAAGVRLTPAEVAEALWLAARVDVAGRAPAPRPVPAEPGGVPGEPAELRLPVPDQPRPPEDPPPEPAAAVPSPTGEQVTFEPVPGRPLRVRTAEALPHSGRTMHALRPLKRRRLSGRRVTIDEEATARQVAERGLWTPVWRPALERWLHLTLVLDHTSVGGVWDRLGRELRTLLERLGAFRTVRVARLGPAARRSPLSLADRPGDHLLLVLSDCVGESWWDGEMSRLIAHWARRAPVAILQPLPERLWSRTGLDPLPGRLRSPRAGAPATAYTFASTLRRRGLPAGGLPVPVLEIEPRWLGTWARLVAGRAPGGIDAVVTPAGAAPRHRPVPRPGPEPPAEQRVRDFRAGASAPAYDLARYLSVAKPLNLAVMRLLQSVMVPESRPAHLAEVLYGGLLRPSSPDGAASDDQHFEFLPGVRHELRDTLAASDPERVRAEVSRYLGEHPERTGALFTALASLPGEGRPVPGAPEPFAGVSADLLRRLIGGTGSGAAPARGDRAHLTVLQLNTVPAAGAPLPGAAPDLVVVTGGLARRATPAEYRAVRAELDELRSRLRLPAGRIVVVPGLSDVNAGRCQAYFLDREADGLEPVPPYWPKWEPFAALASRLPGATGFQEHQPWQLYTIPALRTVVAALNSTVPVSHLPGERRGGLGPAQIAWFADRMRDYAGRGWLRVGVVHHDPAGLDRFADQLAPHLDVVLHGQPGGVREAGLSGVPAVGAGDRARVVELRPGVLRVSDGGRAESHAYGDHWWLVEDGAPPPSRAADDPADPARADLLARVARAYRARHPGVPLVERRWTGSPDGYLLVAPDGGRHCIGVFDDEPSTGVVEDFRDTVARREQAGRDATLVCRTPPAPALRRWARARGVRVLGFADFQLGDDVREFAARQVERLGDDPEYAPGGYVPPNDLDDLLRERGPATVWGAPGTGKTFLLRELARRWHATGDPVVPILVDLWHDDWHAPLDQLVAVKLIRGGVREVNPGHIRYLLGEGRYVLLCDRLDERLDLWRAWSRDPSGPVRLIVAGRDAGLLDAALPPERARRIRLDGFGPRRIHDFLTRRLGAERARARLELIGRSGGLSAMAGNPRMLSLLADVDDRLLRSATSGAALYPGLIRAWLDRAGSSQELWRAVGTLARRLWESGESALGADADAEVLARLAGPLLVRDPQNRFRFADHVVLEWLVAREIAGRLDRGPLSASLRLLLARQMSPLMAQFVGDLAGHDRARAWAEAVLSDPDSPGRIRAAARLVLAHLA
ncbi:SAV_2336 N-terminal domain-related protein [Actinoplanes siamensis]|uniref:SAV_2336 N-terminal domain-related protein n=1 Tax=Actinoplanes siamensis TaxID=1223317 RepID=UPI00361F0C3B